MGTCTQLRFKRIDHVELRVRDLAQSEAFYDGLLGMTKREIGGSGEHVSVYVAESDDGQPAFSIVLAEGVPAGMEMAGLDHICLEVATVGDVDEVHAAATAAGVRTTSPRARQGRYQTFVFDPDGHKLEIAAQNCDTNKA